MRKGNKTALIAIITVLSLLLATLIGLMIFFMVDNDVASENGKNPAKENEAAPVITITSCPDQVDSTNPYATVSGVLMSDSSACTLSINGEVVTSTNAPGTQANWSKTYQLSSGETRTLQIEARDAENHVTSMTKTIYCQKLNTITEKKTYSIRPWCSFVKKNKNGLNVRAYPGTQYSIVYYIGKNDFTTRMTYTGNRQTGTDGYTWYEVIVPTGRYGYVRSDLVRAVN